MLKSSWVRELAIGLVFVALVFVWAAFRVGSEIGESRGERNKNTTYYQHHAEDQVRRTCLDGQAGDVAKCVTEIIKSTNEDKRAEDDRIAQTEMARWSLYMLIATVAMAIITLAGVYYVWRTIKVTQEIGRDQVRAYVEVASVQFYWGTDRGDRPRFRLLIDNYGETPAKWFQLRQAYKVFEHTDGGPNYTSFSELTLPRKFGQRWNGIRPRGEAMGTSGPPVRDLAEIKKCWRDPPNIKGMPPDNTHGVMVYGEIKYCTIFNEVYVSQFCFGTGSLEAYEAEEIVERDRVVKRGVTYTHSTSFEKPQKLTRIAIELDLFRREQSPD